MSKGYYHRALPLTYGKSSIKSWVMANLWEVSEPSFYDELKKLELLYEL